jgi:hypothetical protein
MSIIETPKNINTPSAWATALKAKYGSERCTAARKALGIPSNKIAEDQRPAMEQWLKANATPLAAEPVEEWESEPERSALHIAALAYVARGVPVFPCRADSKAPACAHGHKDATTDVEQINAWWLADPNQNIGLEPERIGQCVIDIDPGAEPQSFPDTYEVTTPRGGSHLYYKGSLPPTAGKLAEHIDTRGRNSYVLVPPSVVDGKPYVVKHDRPLAELPAGIAETLAKASETQKASTTELDTPANIARARTLLLGNVERGDVAISGQGGNNRTYRLAAEVQALGLSPDECLEQLEKHWNLYCLPPWEHGELATVVRNATAYMQNEAGANAVPPAAEVFGEYAEQAKAEQTIDGDDEPPAGVSIEQWRRLREKYRLRDPVEEANRPPLTFWDELKLWPKSPEGAVGLVYGDTGTHKTGFSLSKAIDLVFNHPDKPRVAFYAGEGAHAFGQARVSAACQHYGKTVADLKATGRFHQISAAPVLTNATEMMAAESRLRAFNPDIIVIETFSRAIEGNYNAPDVVNGAYKMVEEWRLKYRALIVIAHHEGKDASRGATGNKMITNNSDFVLYLAKVNPFTVNVYVEKMRDGKDDFEVGYRVHRYSVGDTQDIPVLAPMTDTELEIAKRRTTQDAAKKTAANDRQRIYEIYIERGIKDWETGLRETGDLADLLCEKVMGGPEPKNDKKKAEKWRLERLRLYRMLINGKRRGKSLKPPALEGLFDERVIGKSNQSQVRWFPTEELDIEGLVEKEQEAFELSPDSHQTLQ